MNEQNQQPNTSKINNSQPEPNESFEQEAPFYNVLPKDGTQGSMVAPKLQVILETDLIENQPNPIVAFIKAHKTIVIFIAIILLLLYPVYYAYNKFLVGQQAEENLLSEEAIKQLQGGLKNQSGASQELLYKTPADWQKKYFGSETCGTLEVCGDDADPDHDGLSNISEYEKATDPNNPDSDGDGLADGDEINVFNSDPTNANTAGDMKYNDGQNIFGGYNPQIKDQKLDSQELAGITDKMKQSKLHQPTVTTLKEALLNIYHFSDEATQNLLENPPNASSTASSTAANLSDIDQSPEAKQDRDTQRSNAIKNIAIALVKYFEDKKDYPATTNFTEMFNVVKIYTKVATNPIDPVNKDKYVYTYAPASNNLEFTLTFFSESQNQIIRTKAADGKKYMGQEQAALYDDQRKNNLETIRTALLLYSSNRAGGNQEYVFPKKEEIQTALIPEYITEMPKDPKTNEPYEYQVSETFDSFTLKAILDAPPTGRTGYLCNQEECRNY